MGRRLFCQRIFISSSFFFLFLASPRRRSGRVVSLTDLPKESVRQGYRGEVKSEEKK